MSFSVARNTNAWIEVTQSFAEIQPDELITWFVEPAKIARWWGPRSTVEPWAGGKWDIEFPQMDTTLTGEIAEITPTRLMVSWAFSHEPGLPARMICISATANNSGSDLRILQGPYRQSVAFPHDDEDRAGHIDGWQYFLERLATAIAGQRAVEN